MLVFKDFFESCFLNKGSNASFIALIPKREGADQLSEFCLVSLVGSTYKIIAKCLANRLKEVLLRIVLRDQGVFLQGRTMNDGILCTNECIDARIREAIPGVMCKLDLEKAYDHINWDFLQYVMRRCGFGVKWSEWMRRCVSLASFSVLINGVPQGNFGCSRGLHQGDLLSPLLFLLVGGVLGGLLGRAAGVGTFEGFSIGRWWSLTCNLQMIP